MKTLVSSFFIGFLFALGLGISGMTRPDNIVSFLDIFGAWNPSLAFVMAGALLVHGLLYPLIRKRSSPLFSTEWHVQNRRDITAPLIIGSSLFGLGWGLVGYCPAPALVALPSLTWRPFEFVLAMSAGMLLHRIVPFKGRFASNATGLRNS